MKLTSGLQSWITVLTTVLGIGLCATSAGAVDGIVITTRAQKTGLGVIHDPGNTGKLMRYDIKNDVPVGSKVLYDKTGVNVACISPFGDRVAFAKASGVISVVSIDGGPETDLGSYIGDPKTAPKDLPGTGLQWPSSEHGQWIYYGALDNTLRRVNVTTKKDEFVVHFNRYAGGNFGLSMDATPHSGKYIKRTDNYEIRIYDLAKGDGDLFSCPKTGGCGESISPDGSLFTANSGWHTWVNLVDMTGKVQSSFRLSQWDGDPENPALGKTREQVGSAWQYFRWSVNSMNWLAVTQGKLSPGSEYETVYEDTMLYDWVDKKQINVTKNTTGTFERAQGFWELGDKEQSLGFLSGKAPFSIEINDSRIKKDLKWNFGDGSLSSIGKVVRHTYSKPGLYTIRAAQGDETFKGQVTVQKRQAPVANATFLNPQNLVVDFSESVVANKIQARLASGTRIAKTVLNDTGMRMLVQLATPLKGNDKLSLSGITDRAQVPNFLPATPVDIVVPKWPSNASGAVFKWENDKVTNAVLEEDTQQVRAIRVAYDGGKAGIDRYGRMSLEGGRMSTGFYSQFNGLMDTAPIVKADAFSLELTFQTTNLTQKIMLGDKRSPYPARIVNISAWYDNDWSMLLGQDENRLLFSIRTTDNWLDNNDKPIKAALSGHSPLIELTKLTDTAPHHLIVSYIPGKLVAYMDGKQIYEGVVTGHLADWGYGELTFGANHNGGRHNWLGRIENVALYNRFIGPAEAQANSDAVLTKIKARRVMPQLEVEAKLLATSTVPDPKKIAPYRDALVVNEFEISKVVQTPNAWRAQDKVVVGQKIMVAQWGLVEATPTDLTNNKVGDTEHLLLEQYEGHPDKIDQIVTSDSIKGADDSLMLYEPRP